MRFEFCYKNLSALTASAVRAAWNWHSQPWRDYKHTPREIQWAWNPKPLKEGSGREGGVRVHKNPSRIHSNIT